MIKGLMRKVFKVMMLVPRKMHYRKMRKRLKNKDFTIIASDCFATFVYHNLNLRFNSPTINLFFSREDFICFVKNLEGFLSVELSEIEDKNTKYPVGTLTYNGNTVRIDFMHYHSFEEAKNKWDERKQRVNYSNLYIVQTIAGELKREYIDEFEQLPYKNKLIITQKNDFDCAVNVSHPILDLPNYEHGKILQYKSWISCSRYMDDIDYIGFLNG